MSRQLVTFALSGHPHVAKTSRERILEKAREMGYRPNPHARALKRKKTGIVALWIPDQISTHYNHVTRELSRMVKKEGYELIVSEIAGTDMGQIWPNVPVDGILAVDAGELAQKHLINFGYKRIAHATFVAADIPNRSRRAGYELAMRGAGLEPEYILYPFSEDQRATTRKMIQEYIAANGIPEAIFYHSDDVTLGIYCGLCDMKIRSPEQIALVGCDGIEDTEYLEVPLTTLVQPVPEMCAKAWEFLSERIDNPSLPRRNEIIAPRMEIRESSRRPL